jgi:hypothetical protein
VAAWPDVSQSKLNAIARRLNEAREKTLGFEAPAERFANVLRRSVESAVESCYQRERVDSGGSQSATA